MLAIPTGKQMLRPTERRRLNLVAIMMNTVLPWVVFCVLFAVLSFSFHYRHPTWAWALVVVAYVMVFLLALYTWRWRRKGDSPEWLTYSVVALLVAITVAALLGDMNFWYNMQPFYDVENLNTYPDVDPARNRGQQRMDAGRVYFVEGSALDPTKSMAFKNIDTYCVAPIVRDTGAKLVTYDFWAVGINCCSAAPGSFRCGQYSNPKARAGLRLMRDDERPFYRLAVQQAEAAYKIAAAHPLFFFWMEDPVEEMRMYRDTGFKYYLLGIFFYFGLNLLAVVGAVVGFSKM
mmetsp:Transcript_49463/g.108022  ORF Transcript_49463/g.108022 Transcript_49463/m.108022 type:complete len:290 (+) Transcript_49463:159-1028(+)